MAETINNIIRDNYDVKRQIGDLPEVITAVKRYTARVRPRHLVTKQIKKDYQTGNGVFILGSSQYGILGQNELGDNQSVDTLYSVLPRNNVYQEYFSQDEFINTSNTTATIDYTNETVTLQPNEILESEVITKLREPINFINFREHDDFIDINDSATFPFILGLSTFGQTNVSIEVSNDSGVIWHEIQEATRFDFPTSSEDDELKYRLTNIGDTNIVLNNPIVIAVNKL